MHKATMKLWIQTVMIPIAVPMRMNPAVKRADSLGGVNKLQMLILGMCYIKLSKQDSTSLIMLVVSSA